MCYAGLVQSNPIVRYAPMANAAKRWTEAKQGAAGDACRAEFAAGSITLSPKALGMLLTLQSP
eukprot:360207-Chlamydomonas_euryale.AAC.5